MTWLLIAVLGWLWPALAFGQALPFPGPGTAHTTGGGCTTVADSDTSTTESTAAFGYGTDAVYQGSQISATSSYTVCKIVMRMLKTGSPTFTMTASIWSNNAGNPGSLIGTASTSVVASTLSTTEADVTFTGVSAAVTSGTTYHIVLQISAAGDFSNDVAIAHTSTFVADGIKTSDAGVTWVSETSRKAKFTLYK